MHPVVTYMSKRADDCYVNMDNGKYTIMDLIDLKKASNAIYQQILLAKQKKNDIDGQEHSWFKSFLENRRQFCKENGTS